VAMRTADKRAESTGLGHGPAGLGIGALPARDGPERMLPVGWTQPGFVGLGRVQLSSPRHAPFLSTSGIAPARSRMLHRVRGSTVLMPGTCGVAAPATESTRLVPSVDPSNNTSAHCGSAYRQGEMSENGSAAPSELVRGCRQ